MSFKAFDIIPSFLRATSVHAGTKSSKHSPLRSIHYRYSTNDGEAQSLLPRTCKLCLRRSQQYNHLIVGPTSKAISRYAKSEPDGPRRKALSFIKQRAAPSIILPCKAEIATISIHINHHPTCPPSKSHASVARLVAIHVVSTDLSIIWVPYSTAVYGPSNMGVFGAHILDAVS